MEGLVIKKVKNEIWYAEYNIKFNGKYKGFICKCRREYSWEVFISDVFTPIKGNDNFRTLREAKKAVVKYFKKWSAQNENEC